jgi:hypothetical protein
MNSLRIARAAVHVRPAAIARPLQRRGYAEVASDKIKLSLALPHQVRIFGIDADCGFGHRISIKQQQADELSRSLSTSRKMCTSTTSPTKTTSPERNY